MDSSKLIAAVMLAAQIPILAGLGVLFLRGKGAGLVIHTQREWHTTNVPLLLRALAILMFVLAACWVPFLLGLLLDRRWLLWLGIALFTAAAVGGAVYVNTSKRFKK